MSRAFERLYGRLRWHVDVAMQRGIRGEAEDEIEFFAEAVVIGIVGHEFVPDAFGKDFGVVVFVEEAFEEA